MAIFILSLLLFIKVSSQNDVNIYGPGLRPYEIVMPARYFFVNFTSINTDNYTPRFGDDVAAEVTGTGPKGHCRIWVNKLDRKDGTFIVRYKLYEPCYDMAISIYYKSKHIKGSPYKFSGPILADQCNCPQANIDSWLENYGCPTSYKQISNDIGAFKELNMKKQIKQIVNRFHNPESTSFCHYVVKDNEIYRDCYGKHVGFNMFSDNILLFLTRKVVLPDMEMVINLGDWPLVRKGTEPLPVFSWCGSNDTIDILMPTYDITESTIENMGRVTLDTLSVQGSLDRKWSDRENRAFWRGRDSRLERLLLIDITRNNPDLLNASLTNFFFFRDKESTYGPKQPHISFFKFFDYKYLVNVDGTVAAYRLPYLLAGGGMVLKQESPYYEHFYRQLIPWKHFVPVAHDLSDLTEKIRWAINNDEKAKEIGDNARRFANENLLPEHIICYHAVLFSEWSKRIKSKVRVSDGMTHVPQPTFQCDCESLKQTKHVEL